MTFKVFFKDKTKITGVIEKDLSHIPPRELSDERLVSELEMHFSWMITDQVRSSITSLIDEKALKELARIQLEKYDFEAQVTKEVQNRASEWVRSQFEGRR